MSATVGNPALIRAASIVALLWCGVNATRVAPSPFEVIHSIRSPLIHWPGTAIASQRTSARVRSVQVHMPGDNPLVAAIADDIERYLAAHPHAADTAIGVKRYWLSGERTDASIVLVEEALARLERKGVVSRRVVFGGSVVFSALVH